MFAALLRLVTGGQHAEEERLRRNLAGMSERDVELDKLSRELEGITVKVEHKRAQQVHSRAPGASGEHRLELPEELRRPHDGPARPRIPSEP